MCGPPRLASLVPGCPLRPYTWLTRTARVQRGARDRGCKRADWCVPVLGSLGVIVTVIRSQGIHLMVEPIQIEDALKRYPSLPSTLRNWLQSR